VAPGCSGRSLERSDFVGSYEGLWSAANRGTLVLRPDGSYRWQPDSETGPPRQHEGTFTLLQDRDGQWSVTLRDGSEPHHMRGAPFTIFFGRVRSIELADDPICILVKK
jgi:hypothetical protein